MTTQSGTMDNLSTMEGMIDKLVQCSGIELTQKHACVQPQPSNVVDYKVVEEYREKFEVYASKMGNQGEMKEKLLNMIAYWRRKEERNLKGRRRRRRQNQIQAG